MAAKPKDRPFAVIREELIAANGDRAKQDELLAEWSRLRDRLLVEALDPDQD